MKLMEKRLSDEKNFFSSLRLLVLFIVTKCTSSGKKIVKVLRTILVIVGGICLCIAVGAFAVGVPAAYEKDQCGEIPGCKQILFRIFS
jgi:hypothetical protein